MDANKEGMYTFDRIAISTIDGKAYYKIKNLLKLIKIPIVDIVPGTKNSSKLKIVLTTRKEAKYIESEKIIFIDDLDDDPSILKEKIFHKLYGGGKEHLTIGIDPGKRIGIVVYYQNRQVEGIVLDSFEKMEKKIVRLILSNPNANKLIKIGYGNPKFAKKIAQRFIKLFGNKVIIELVDEYGTSSICSSGLNKREIRDQISAMLIAFRQGKRYQT
jgi:hypothetical protein